MEASATKRVVPFDVHYDKAETCFTASYWLSIAVTSIALGLSIVEPNYGLDKDLSALIGYFNTLLIALYLFCDYRGSYLFRIAETERKLAFVDNTFGTKFSESDTQGYYTNDHVGSGIYKLATNNMESCFTSSKNLAYMYKRVLAKNLIIIMLIAFAGFSGEGDYARIAAESLVAGNFALELFKMSVYSSRIKAILKEFYVLFQSLNPSHITNVQTAQIMKQILEYETTVAWANIPLDNQNFTRNRAAWDSQWKGIKARYDIR